MQKPTSAPRKIKLTPREEEMCIRDEIFEIFESQLSFPSYLAYVPGESFKQYIDEDGTVFEVEISVRRY